MTYRERREARIARLEEWAAKRRAKSDQACQRAQQAVAGITFGQPILVDHYSANAHRRAIQRMSSGMDQSLTHARKADEMESRAANIADALDRSIFRDDPDAVEALTAKIADLEAQRARIAAYNKSCRKGAPDLSLLDEKQRRDLAVTIQYAPYQLGKNGAFPAYASSNIGGRISAARKRLAELTPPTNDRS